MVEAPTKTMRTVLGERAKRHRRPAPAEGVGHQPVGRRGVRQEAEERPRLAVGRIVDEQLARRAAQVLVLAGIPDEDGVPGLEHVPRLERIGGGVHAERGRPLDLLVEVDPLLGRDRPVGQRRRFGEEPLAGHAVAARDACRGGPAWYRRPGRRPISGRSRANGGRPSTTRVAISATTRQNRTDTTDSSPFPRNFRTSHTSIDV